VDHAPASENGVASAARSSSDQEFTENGNGILPGDDGIVDGSNTDRRYKHNIAERRRTSRINSLFEQLDATLGMRPDLYHSAHSQVSKAETLQDAVRCVRTCFDSLDMLHEQIRQLQQGIGTKRQIPLEHQCQTAPRVSRTTPVPPNSPQKPIRSLYHLRSV